MIEIRDLYKSFREHRILDGLNLKIEKGQTCVIIGCSGCGKSVLLKHIVGILKPDSGSVFVDGKEVNRLPQNELDRLRMSMSLVFQGGALFDSLSVAENVGFGLIEHKQLDRQEILERVENALCMVDLCGSGNLMPAQLSGGMRKRVALARAICIRPQIIFYDEPTTGVDPITADAVNELIKELHDRLQVTSVVVTHDMKSAYKVGDRIAMMYKGRIIAEGSPEEIQRLDNPVVHQFINGLATGPITEGSEMLDKRRI